MAHMNDLYDMPPLTLQGTYLTLDTIMLCYKLGGCISLVEVLLWQ